MANASSFTEELLVDTDGCIEVSLNVLSDITEIAQPGAIGDHSNGCIRLSSDGGGGVAGALALYQLLTRTGSWTSSSKDEFTLLAWVKPYATGAKQVLFNRQYNYLGSGNPEDEATSEYQVYIRSDGVWCVKIWQGADMGDLTPAEWATKFTATAGVWQMIAVTFSNVPAYDVDPGTCDVVFYCNNDSDSHHFSKGFWDCMNYPLIGVSDSDDAYLESINSYIDEIAGWDSILTAGQVSGLYAAGIESDAAWLTYINALNPVNLFRLGEAALPFQSSFPTCDFTAVNTAWTTYYNGTASPVMKLKRSATSYTIGITGGSITPTAAYPVRIYPSEYHDGVAAASPTNGVTTVGLTISKPYIYVSGLRIGNGSASGTVSVSGSVGGSVINGCVVYWKNTTSGAYGCKIYDVVGTFTMMNCAAYCNTVRATDKGANGYYIYVTASSKTGTVNMYNCSTNQANNSAVGSAGNGFRITSETGSTSSVLTVNLYNCVSIFNNLGTIAYPTYTSKGRDYFGYEFGAGNVTINAYNCVCADSSLTDTTCIYSATRGTVTAGMSRWDTAYTYPLGWYVYYGSDVYLSIKDSPANAGKQPDSNADYWSLAYTGKGAADLFVNTDTNHTPAAGGPLIPANGLNYYSSGVTRDMIGHPRPNGTPVFARGPIEVWKYPELHSASAGVGTGIMTGVG